MKPKKLNKMPSQPKYTQQGCNLNEINIKIQLFKLLWPHMRDNDCSEEHINRIAFAYPQHITVFKKSFLYNKTCLNLLRRLDRKLIALKNSRGLLFCDDMDIVKALKDLFIHAKKTTVLSKISMLRQAFHKIGREHAWVHNCWVKDHDYTIAYSGNPITNHVKNELLALIEN